MPIYKSKDGYKIENVKGVSKTKSDAIKRLKAIKANENNSDKDYKVAARRSNKERSMGV